MHEVSVEQLRNLRERSRKLSKHIRADLLPFLHSDKVTFRRTPESPSIPDDVNVTTTCSCLMALALTNQLTVDGVPKYARADAVSAFAKLVDAPWMSSGLTENNAFTTILVLRTLGVMIEKEILPLSEVTLPDRKEWHLNLGIARLDDLIRLLNAHTDTASEFIWRSLTDNARRYISDQVAGASAVSATRDSPLLTLELGRLIQSWIYEPSRFPNTSDQTRERLLASTTTYQLAEANRLLLVETYPKVFEKATKKSFSEIAARMAGSADNFRINDYPSASAVLYWFIDGITRANVQLLPEDWVSLCERAAEQFNHERSLVAAGHGAKMDPVAMAMAACLCSRLRAIIVDPAMSASGGLGPTREQLAVLPSRTELEHSIRELWKFQTNGIWPKYFPLFHYQHAGSNFCFTFEMLEAILAEFGREENALLDDEGFIRGLESAITWCEINQLRWPGKDAEYTRWNSGGNLETLGKDQPEAWATAVVHMFLWELERVLSARIQKRLLREYAARQMKHESAGVSGLLDIEILEKGVPKGLKLILTDEVVEKTKKENANTLATRSIKGARSALLFGPPGTSKTRVTEAVARDLDWPLIQIDPSHFLRRGLDGIYLEANKIFSDLMDLSGVIVLFDEMDALVQTRASESKLDTAGQFLTTFMLPKLTALHDLGRIIFMMATNFQERFDPAIKRTGRFDLLLCMGPPTLKEKLLNIHMFMGEKTSTPDSERTAGLIRKYLSKDPEASLQLELYTFGEFMSLIKSFGASKIDIVNKIKAMSPRGFATAIKEDSEYVGLRTDDLETLKNRPGGIPKTLAALDELKLSHRRLKQMQIEATPIIRYLADRQESKQQR